MNLMDDAQLREIPLESRRVFDGPILHIDHMNVRLPNGKIALREIARHAGAAAVVPIDDEGNVYLVRQYRSPFDRILLEIPAGKLDHIGEDTLEAAKRELGEETGLTADYWQKLTDLYTSVGFTDESIGIYLATGLVQGKEHLDEDEFLNVVKMPLGEAIDLALHNEIHDSKTVCGLILAREALLR